MSRIRLLAFASAIILTAVVVGCGDPGPTATAPTNQDPGPGEPAPPPIDVPDADLKALVEGNNRFAIELYKKLAEKHDGNIVLSPYSISSALAMTYAGARGKTAEEMAKVLGLTGLGDRAHPAHAALARRLRNEGGRGVLEFLIANALWGQRGVSFKDEFLRLSRAHYGAGLREVDFAADADGSRRMINAWVSDQTRDKIPELLKPTDLSPESKLILTNAIYFKANWAFQFKKENTKDGPFRVSEAKTITIPLMKQTAKLRYAEGDSAQIVELPYLDRSFAMVVVLPARPEDIGRTTAALADGGLGRWLNQATECDVELTLPMFRSRMVTSLGPPLEELGMGMAFSPAADFTSLAPTGGLRITRVVHEACVEVNEKGTEATAATAVVAGDGLPRIISFRADRPFLYLIRDSNSGAVLFIGRLGDPMR